MEWNAHSLSIHKLLDFHLLVPPGLHLLLLLLFLFLLLLLTLLLAVRTLVTTGHHVECVCVCVLIHFNQNAEKTEPIKQSCAEITLTNKLMSHTPVADRVLVYAEEGVVRLKHRAELVLEGRRVADTGLQQGEVSNPTKMRK